MLCGVGFTIEEAAAVETLNVAVALRDLDVADCALAGSRPEQSELFAFRNNVGSSDIAVYVVGEVVNLEGALGTRTSWVRNFHPAGDDPPALSGEASTRDRHGNLATCGKRCTPA